MVLAGQVMLGAVTSFSVTKKLQLAELLLASVAVSITDSTSLWPLNPVPAAGLWVTVGFMVQLSLRDNGE